MAHDVFISYSTKDKTVADAVCHALEQSSIRCWIAPRDEIAGLNYFVQITEAIRSSRLMVLVFSASSNISKDVIREVSSALENSLTVIPFRLEDVRPEAELSYLLQGVHWLDAHPNQQDFAELVEHVCRNLGETPTQGGSSAIPDTSHSEHSSEKVPSPQAMSEVSSPTVSPSISERQSIIQASTDIEPGSRHVSQIFSGQILSRIDAKGCNFTRAVFRGCDLRLARLDNVILTEANLANARLDAAVLRGARVDFANLQGTSCVDADFEYARVTRTDFRRADLTRTNFRLLDGQEAVFEDAKAPNANFESTLLNNADFRDADLHEAIFTDAILDGACLQGANLLGARGLTAEQLRTAIIDNSTRLDEDLRAALQ